MSLTPPPRQTPAQMRATLAAALAQWNGRSPLWVFGYGSLIWNPELDFDCRAPARVYGYHRRLCLRSVRNRGTHDCPGLVAGLDRGGSCCGVVYRVPPAAVHAQFERLWEREMFMGSYLPRWLSCRRLDRRQTVTALSFVVRRDAFNYCGQLTEREMVGILQRACGIYGSSLEYLQRIVHSLRDAGLRDPHLERLARCATPNANA
jgi:glutathione-specific gamma-glutamylcyclotransferase